MRCGRLCLSCNNYIAATTATEKLPIVGSLFATSVVSNDPDATRSTLYHGTIVHENTSAKQALATLHDNPQNVLIYQGKFGQGAALLAALQRRIRRRQQLPNKATSTVTEQWLAYRHHQQVQARLLNRFLMHVVPQQPILTGSSSSTASKAPPPPPPHVADVLNQAALSSSSSTSEPYLIPWREIQARIAAAEWQRKGVWMDALQDYIYPHFDVYPPSRQEYLRLLPTLPLLDKDGDDDDDSSSSSHSRRGVLMDIGTGTGALTAILLKRHPWSAIATDISPLAVTCARENLTRLGLAARVQCVQANLFPPCNGDNTTVQKADVILCNPPWIPVTTTVTSNDNSHAWIDRAIYDDGDSSMLRGFLQQAASHLRNDHGQVWLIMSDLAEHLQLRSRQQLLDWIHDGNLEIVETRQATPARRIGNQKGNKSNKRDDMEAKFFPLVAQARRAEITYLFRLRKQQRIF